MSAHNRLRLSAGTNMGQNDLIKHDFRSWNIILIFIISIRKVGHNTVQSLCVIQYRRLSHWYRGVLLFWCRQRYYRYGVHIVGSYRYAVPLLSTYVILLLTNHTVGLLETGGPILTAFYLRSWSMFSIQRSQCHTAFYKCIRALST